MFDIHRIAVGTGSFCVFIFSYLGPYPSVDLFRKIDNFIGPQLTTLASVVGEQSVKKQLRYQVVQLFSRVDS